VHNSVRLAPIVKKRHQLMVFRTVYNIGIAPATYVFFFHPREKAIELFVKVFTVSLSQSQTHAETDNAFHLCLSAVVKNPGYIFLSIVYEGQYRAKPHHRGNSCITQCFKRFKALRRYADVRLELPAQLVIEGSKCHLDNAFCFGIYLAQKFDITQDKIRFRYHRCSAAVFEYYLKRTSGKTQFLLQRHIGIAHRTRTNHAGASLPAKCVIKEGDGIFLDLDIFKVMCHVITSTSRIAVDAAVLAPTVYVDSVFGRQNSLCRNAMHACTPNFFLKIIAYNRNHWKNRTADLLNAMLHR